ncbi:MAG TPA: arsenic resistance N-acetyltransferase ArsN2 [Shinella sp.]|jgi:N-acetylglutamate synthase-like GNAT family acetyltransferase|uniref:arsenic resistance N-acetyltransferase ArsN2 n=1 Tax=Shinella sp. TaxID=1870904 RepID=UPI0029BE69BB|nr:arsenic resistance N-acetyltransferase ArsN2 [Shinella sp.]MDX3978482.1 arsenic resistance N-acetyltransferase ArsN2 [Shinella sp.]HEV7247578.1 arsenic resistance N-acetyltransferase ArsN2 [Shinella sp.]
MSAIKLEQVTGSDLDLKTALTGARLPTDDIEDQGRTFFKAVSADDRIVGFSGVERCGDDYLLRSVVVLPDRRGSGLGRAVVEATLARVARESDVFLATTSAAPFFTRIGFTEVRRGSVPAAVLATRQLSSICPSSATIMKLIKPPT